MINKTKLSFILSVAACVLSAVMLVTACLAWFAFNTDTNVGGIDFVTSTSRITFGDEITSRRKLSGRETITTVYTKDSDGLYYTLNTSGAKEYFSMTGILPGEAIDITATLSAEMLSNNFGLEIGLGGMYGDIFEYEDKSYSVLGVFCVYPFVYDATRIDESEDNDGFILSESDRKWLCEYTESTTTTDTSVAIQYDKWSNLCLDETGNTATVKFRLELNLAQYNEQNIMQTNLLSQKNVGIGSVYALVML